MGRNRIPTAIQDAKGAFIHDPQRARPNEPKSDRPLGSAPKYLSKDEKKLWKEIAKRIPSGVLTAADADAYEMLVRLTHKMHTSFDSMMASDRAQLVSLWSRFAMTPADRSKVMVDKPAESKLDAFRKKLPVKLEVPQLAN